MYIEADFPFLSKMMVESPRDLGMSRADLWSFAGLVALDRVQQQSRKLCEEDKHGLTCNDWKSSCWSPFPEKFKNSLFKTGRVDCIPSSSATSKQGYLASKVESTPDQNGNGPKTAKYFKDNFNMNPREALALMGAHTIGEYSTFQTHIDYAWVRAHGSRRNQVFNNEYYKTLAARPHHTKDKYCVGTIDGGPPKHEWYVKNLLFEFFWPQGGKWIDKPRRLLWNHFVTRGPVCAAQEEDKNGDGDMFWNVPELDATVQKYGYSSFWKYCCENKKTGCKKENKCEQDLFKQCTRTVQNRIRHLSSDVGFYLKWETDALGYPTGCDAFAGIGQQESIWNSPKNFANKDGLQQASGKVRNDRRAGCPLQDMKDGHGKDMWETVEMFADNQELWIQAFVKAWRKMSIKGYKSNELTNGPTSFWTHF